MKNEFDSEFIDWSRNRKFKEDTRRFDNITRSTIKCKCGHSVLMSAGTDKMICSWCNNYVFRDKETEFKYRMKEKLK